MPRSYGSHDAVVLDTRDCGHQPYATVAYADGPIHHHVDACRTCLPAEVEHAGLVGDMGVFRVSRIEAEAA